MIINNKLNKKQQIVGWVMMISIMVVILRTTLAIFSLPDIAYCNIRIFYYLYYFIIITGGLLICALRSKKKG